MDPLTWIAVVAFGAWLLRNLWEDGVAAWRGTTPPRLIRKAARREAAKERADSGDPSIVQVVGVRLANRVANPPDRRFWKSVRAYVDDVLADSMEDMRDGHEVRVRRRRAKRRQRWERQAAEDQAEREARNHDRGTDGTDGTDDYGDEPEDVVDNYPCEGGCGVHFLEPGRWCDECAAPPTPPSPAPQPEPLRPDRTATPTTRKDTPPMSAPHEIRGDATTPLEMLAYATACADLGPGVAAEWDTIVANLDGSGVHGDGVNLAARIAEAARDFGAAAALARNVYAGHVVTQAEIARNDALADTVRDTYLDTRTA